VNAEVALVTGAAGGIGAEIARALLENGLSVALLDRDGHRVQELAEKIDATGRQTLAVTADVTSSVAVDTAVTRIEDELGPIAVLANVAGVLWTAPVADLTDAAWEETFAVNVGGVFRVSRAVAAKMIPRRRGAIVTVTSNAASTARTYMSAYSASKAAATMFTKCLGLELAAYGIRCNVVAPGSTDTSMLRSLWSDGSSARMSIEGQPSAFRVGIPLGKLAKPADIASAVLFLLSDQAAHITMHDLTVDGGATLGV